MKRGVVFLLLLSVYGHGADILALVGMLDRNDTAGFERMVTTQEDANAQRPDNNKTILMYASWVGNHQAIKWLISHGADVNATDSQGATALHLAIWKRHTPIALYLLEHGASPFTVSHEGMTPSDIALFQKNTTVMEAIQRRKPRLKSIF